MQKKLIALAIAGLSGAAFAQSNVTIYGVMDMDFGSSRATGATNNVGNLLVGIDQPSRNRLNSNSSHIGFKGAESLGNGLTAVFQMESGVAAETAGAALAGGRDTYIGLAGGFGTVAAGLLTGPYRAAVASFEVVPGATGVGANVMNIAGKAIINVGSVSTTAVAADVAQAAGTTLATATRVQNTLAYITPNFNGFQGTFAHSTGPIAAEAKTATPNAAGTSSVNAKAWTMGLTYNNGPLKAVFAWQSIKDAAALFATDSTVDANGETVVGAANNRSANSKIESWILGAGYTFNGATTVNLAYDVNKASASGSQAGAAAVPAVAAGDVRFDSTRQKTWILSAKHVMGAHEIAGSWVRARSTVDATYGVGTTAVKGEDDQGATGLALRYGYNFSKRTQAYAVYSQINNQSNGRYDYTTGAVGVSGNGADPRSWGVGLRHSF